MKKSKRWIHILLAIGMISFAAILGQLKNSWGESKVEFDSSESPLENSKVEEAEPEVLVKFRSGVTKEEIINLVSRNNDRIEDKIEIVDNLYSIDDFDGETSKEIVKQYVALGDMVEYAEPNEMIVLDDPAISPLKSVSAIGVSSNATPNDPLIEEQWSLLNSGKNGGKQNADIAALKAWESTTGSEEVVIAVLDTGVDYNHEDLSKNMWVRPDSIPMYADEELGAIDDSYGFNADANSGDPMDTNGHGTHCAGIIGASGNNGVGIAGINWNVKIMPLKFLGSGGFGSTKNAIEAINYAVERKKAGVNIRVINASFGSTLYSKALESAIREAGKEGILFVAAAGNNKTNNDRRAHYPSNFDLPNIISVAASDRNDGLASFSNFGENTVHISAPGKDIMSTWLNNQYREASGTSMAAPQVVGVAGLIIAQNPDITVEDLRHKLENGIDKRDTFLGKVRNGGRLNAAKALSN